MDYTPLNPLNSCTFKPSYNVYKNENELDDATNVITLEKKNNVSDPNLNMNKCKQKCSI